MVDEKLIFTIAVDDKGQPVIKRINEGLKETSDSANKASKSVSKLGTSLDGLKSAAGAASAAMAAVGTAAAAGVVKATATFATFDDQMRAVGAISGATGKDLQALTDIAQKMGSETRYSASQSAEALQYMAMAGMSVEQSIAGLPGVLQLAAANQMDLATAADITTNVLSGMGLEISELSRVNDVLTKTAHSANTNVLELGEAMKVAGPAAKGSNQTLEQTMAILGGLADNGIKGAEAGHAYKRMLITLQGPTSKQAEALQRLGVSTVDASGNFRGLAPIMADLGAKQITLTDAVDVFGKFTATSAIAVAGYSGKISELGGKLETASGTASKAASDMEAGLGGAFRSLMSAWEGFQIAFGKGLEPGATEALNYVKETVVDLTKTVTGWAESGALKEISTTVVDVFKYLTDWQKPIAHVDRALIELQKTYLQVKKVAIEAATVGFADTSDIDARIDALKRRDEAAKITIKNLEEENQSIVKQNTLSKEAARASIESAQTKVEGEKLAQAAMSNTAKVSQEATSSQVDDTEKIIAKELEYIKVLDNSLESTIEIIDRRMAMVKGENDLAASADNATTSLYNQVNVQKELEIGSDATTQALLDQALAMDGISNKMQGTTIETENFVNAGIDGFDKVNGTLSDLRETTKYVQTELQGLSFEGKAFAFQQTAALDVMHGIEKEYKAIQNQALKLGLEIDFQKVKYSELDTIIEKTLASEKERATEGTRIAEQESKKVLEIEDKKYKEIDRMKRASVSEMEITGLDELKQMKLQVEIKVDKANLTKEIKEVLRREGLTVSN